MNKEFNLTETDLLELFSDKKISSRPNWRGFARFFGVFILLYLTTFVIVNFQGLKTNLLYWYRTEYEMQPTNKQTVNVVNQNTNQANTVTITDSNKLPIDNNHIRIESIGVYAPIAWRVPNEPEDVKIALQKGVIQIEGTALPGQTGNIFITGHSSDLLWAKGDYKTVFVLLNKLVVGDQIKLKYQENEYIYKVSEIKVVNPENLSVMEQTSEPVLTLATCTPVGTTLRRLIVVSKQIFPNPKYNIKSQETKQQKIPTAR